MKKISSFLFYILPLFFLAQNKVNSADGYFFHENKGQIIDQDGLPNPNVKYLFNAGGLNVQIRENGFSYDVYETERKLIPSSNKKVDKPQKNIQLRDRIEIKQKFHRIDFEFINAEKKPQIIAEERSEDYENYYNIPSKPQGIERVFRYKKITYKNLYPNIDLVFFKPKDTLKPIEYNFIVQPGGKVSDIQFKINGAETSLKNGKISMNLRFGELQESIPNSWIVGEKSVGVQFIQKEKNIFGFKTDQNTFNKTLIIDPVPTRIWGSYFGGNGEEGLCIKTDEESSLYLYGTTSSTNNIATSGAFQVSRSGGYDGFINKVTKDGQKLWGSYYGKKYYDCILGIDFDANRNIYMGAYVQIPNPSYPNNPYYYFPKVSILKLDSNGTLIFEKLYGEDISDFWNSYPDEFTIYDARYYNNNFYITGDTRFDIFSTAGAFQESIMGASLYTGMLGKFDASDGNVKWFTYVGGSESVGTDGSSSSLFSIFSNDNGIEIVGNTKAKDFPMINPFQSQNLGGNSGNSGLYVKFSESGALLKSSYFGETNKAYINDSARRFGDEVWFSSQVSNQKLANVTIANTLSNVITNSIEIEVPKAFQTITYIDKDKNLYITGLGCPGETGMSEITTPDAYMPTLGSSCASYFLKYNSNFEKVWGTFYTGNGGTQLGQVLKDNENFLYFYGMSSNNTSGIATPGTFQQTQDTPWVSNDAFIAKFKDCTSFASGSSNSPVCIGATIQLNAAGGASYHWTGPNGFTSSLQNPTIPNATTANSGTYSCTVTGTGDCDGTFSIEVVVGDSLAPVPQMGDLPPITGDCTTIISTFPTAIDQCAGTIIGTTSDPLQYLTPGNYTITWTYNDGNGNSSTQTQDVVISSPALPIAPANPQVFCEIDEPKIQDLTITGSNITWYDSAGNILPTTHLLEDGTSYFASQNTSGCESATIEIEVQLNSTETPTLNTPQEFCESQVPTLADLQVQGTNIQFYDALGNLLPSSTLLVNNETYFVTQTINGCTSEKIAVQVLVSQNNLPAIDITDAFCNDVIGSTKILNLKEYEEKIITNSSLYIFEYFDAIGYPITNPESYILNLGLNEINVKVSTTDGCFKNIKINLTVFEKPNIQLPEMVEFCDGQTYTLDAGIGFTSYQWSTGETSQSIIISKEGTYSVTVKNSNGCETTSTTIAKHSVMAQIVSIVITNNDVEIVLSENGNYEYSLDGISWKSSNIFTDLPSGNYTVYVRTGTCLVDQQNFTIFNITNAFTPNNDGINDTWRITGMENYPNSTVQIYDRFGTLILNETVKSNTFVWNGEYNSRRVASGSYWYVITLSDSRIMNGWLVVKNRN